MLNFAITPSFVSKTMILDKKNNKNSDDVVLIFFLLLVQRPPLGHVLSPGWQQASVCESVAGERCESEGFPAGGGNSV